MLRCGIISGGPNGFEFLGSDIELKPPTPQMPPFLWQHGVKWKVGRGQRFPHSCQLAFRRDSIQLKQITKTADHCADPEAERIVHEFGPVSYTHLRAHET